MYVLKKTLDDDHSSNNFQFEDKRKKYRKILFTSKSFKSQIKTSSYSKAMWFSNRGNNAVFWRVI
jgi:hypothetical protein